MSSSNALNRMQNCRLKIAISFVSRFNRFSGKTNAKLRISRMDRKINSKLFQKHDCVISARTTTPRQKQTVKTKWKHVFSSYLVFSITWSLKLNIAFLYLSNGKVIDISGRFLTRNFEFLFWMEGAQQKRREVFNQSLARFWDVNT